MSETEILAVRDAIREFLDAFENLDWERFRHCFSLYATVFFPFDSNPYRADGQEEVEAGFKRFFDEVRTRRVGPPYLHLQPQDMRVHVWHDAALVTFHLGGIDRLSRRTIFLQKQEAQWRIVHIHGSNMHVQNA